MSFNSIHFLFFLPVVFVVVGGLSLRWRNRFLLVASYYFYASWDWRFVSLLLLSTVVDFWGARGICATEQQATRRRILAVCVSFNLAILGIFKYADFFVETAAALLETAGLHPSHSALSIILPVGISFYTFQSMSYIIDVYRGELRPVTRFVDYALYVAYFPQLVAGPIERATHLLPQLLRPAPVTFERINQGLTLMLLGFVKKVLIADNLAPEVDRIFAHPEAMSAGVLLKGAYYFAFQIYCDFSGYTDIARGVSQLLGVQLRLNFTQPYLSANITEFWRRWHMSLSNWLRDYLYIPLGGNRHGPMRTYRNLMLTMLIGGLWHGANWTFVVWGGIHGGMLALERLLGVNRQVPETVDGGWVRVLRRVPPTVLTFHLAVFAFVFFRCPSVGNAFSYVVGILAMDNLAAMGLGPLLVGATIFLMDIAQRVGGDDTVFVRLPWWVQSPLYASACLALLILGGAEVPFIYFQF